MIRETLWAYKWVNPLIGLRGLRGINSKNGVSFIISVIFHYGNIIVINKWPIEAWSELIPYVTSIESVLIYGINYYWNVWINSSNLFYFSIWMKRIKGDWLYLLIILTIHCWIWESADWGKPTNTYRRTY